MARRGGRSSRTRSSRAAPAQRTPTPANPTDDEMPDAPTSAQGTPQEIGTEENEDEEEQEEAEDVMAAPSPTPVESEGTPRLRLRASSALPARRRPGRPPKRPVDWDGADAERTPSETPKRRGGFRGGSAWRGGRWKNRGQGHVSQVPLDKDGNMANVVNDEVELSDDPDGETKVGKEGYLKDGREYRVRTFTVADKGNRLYMLSTEPARCIGFRDSYLFFQKHRQLFKVILTDNAKADLIERDLIPHSYKGRAIGVVTARSVFREFGAKIVIGGKKITDDYQVTQARANGDVEGELAVPEDQIAAQADEYDRNRYVAWHGASAVYHSTVPSVPITMERPSLTKRRKVQVTGSNWMLEHARAASQFNSMIANVRRQNLNGVYDIYTNQMLYPAIMQHTHAKWEPIPEGYDPLAAIPTINNDSTTAAINGHPDTNNQDHTSLPSPPLPTIDQVPPLINGHPLSSSSSSASIPTPPLITTLPTSQPPIPSATSITTTTPEGHNLHLPISLSRPLPKAQHNRLLTVDTHILHPPNPTATLGYPGPDGPSFDLGSKTLSAVPDELIELLPPECKEAFLQERAKEEEWRGFWGTEKEDGRREGGDGMTGEWNEKERWEEFWGLKGDLSGGGDAMMGLGLMGSGRGEAAGRSSYYAGDK